MHGTLPITTSTDDVGAYLAHARAMGFRARIHAAFERADKLKITFVGETIIDEYRYVKPLAKPSKEFILATVEMRAPDRFLGGAIAASLHGEWPLATVLTDNGEPIRKTRFVDVDFSRKLFEVYSRDRIDLDEERRGRFHGKLIAVARDSDVLIVLDFGHGLMNAQERHIAESVKFLAVNAQTNAGNYGFNPVTNYRAPHYVCVDEPEARVATRIQNGDLPVVMAALADVMPKSKMVVTRGRYGCCVCDQTIVDDAIGQFGFTTVPPLATGGIDTIGAGDAFLAVSAPLIAAGLDLEAAAFVGNIAGAIKVSILGHQRHVGRAEVLAKVDELLG